MLNSQKINNWCMTFIITKSSIADAHETLIQHIMKHGTEILTESNEKTKEITDVRIKVTSPMISPRISPKCFMKIKGFTEYAKNLIYGYRDTVIFEYDYHERLRKWGDHKISLYDTDVSIDQIKYIINKLQSQITSRRALAVTWIPCYDDEKDDVPCLQFVQCLIRNKKLDMYVVFRSEDILSAFGQNIYGLTEMQKYIADALELPVGDYHHYIISAHIYHTRDAHELSRFMDA